MKNLITFTLLFLLAFSLQAGNKGYEQKMGELLGKMETCKTADDFQELANQFERVAQAEKKEWLPRYYQAQCLITATFVDRAASMDEKDALLDGAEEIIQEVMKKNPKESEVYVLHSLYLSARLSVDPATRGQQYSMLSQQAVTKALLIDPENPRANYMKLANDLGRTRFFKGDTSQFCEQAQSLLENWDDFQPASPIHPNWGKDSVEEIIASCNQ